MPRLPQFILTRSDEDGSWTLISEQGQLLTFGNADKNEWGEWDRPNFWDYGDAIRTLREG